jgi:methyl-accepting chemotaxis protein
MRDRRIRHRGVRAVALGLLVVLVAGLFAVVFRQSWTANAADTGLVADERQRVGYLGPLTHLIGALSEAQYSAVRGLTVDTTSVQSAVDAVDGVDHRYGGTLDTSQRWNDLRGRVIALAAQPGSGRSAYRDFTDVLNLALDLVRRVGDTSDQMVEPRLDSFYVLDTALLRLPRAIVSAGYAADLATMATGGTVTGDDALQVAVAQDDVAQAAADTSAGLSKGIEATTRSGLGAGLAGKLDEFRASVDEFAPSAVLDKPTGPVDAYGLPPAAGLVRVAALALFDAVLSQLDALLTDRAASLAGQHRLTVGTGIGLGVALALLLWVGLAGILAGSRQPAEPTAPEPDEPTVEPMRLLDFGELVPAGRIPGQHRESDTHAG